MKKLMTVGFAMLFAVSLVNCSKKKPAQRSNSGKAPVTNPVVVPPNPNPVRPPVDTNAAKTVIEGKFWTDCGEIQVGADNGKGFYRSLVVEGDRLTYVEFLYPSEQACNDDENGTTGTASTDSNSNFSSKFRIAASQGTDMTHRVDYIESDGSISHSWLLKLAANGQTFVSAKLNYLNSRAQSDINDTYTKH